MIPLFVKHNLQVRNALQLSRLTKCNFLIGDTEERLQNLEKIAVHQNKVMEEMHQAMLKTTPEPPKTTITTTVEQNNQSVHDLIMVEHIKEMAKLQRQLLLQQHQAQMANLESKKDAVRDEIEQVAELLINGRRAPRRSDSASAASETKGLGNLRQLLLRQGRGPLAARLTKKFDRMPSVQAVAWHQRFTDNFRLRQLQHQALRLRGPVLMPEN